MSKFTVKLSDELVAVVREVQAERSCSATEALRWMLEMDRAMVAEPEPEVPPGICGLCGKPMPPGEEMFKYHGLSGPCPPGDNERTDG